VPALLTCTLPCSGPETIPSRRMSPFVSLACASALIVSGTFSRVLTLLLSAVGAELVGLSSVAVKSRTASIASNVSVA